MPSFSPAPPHKGVVVVTHDLYPYGAQRVTTSLVHSLVRDFSLPCEVVSLGGGPLALSIRGLVPVHNVGQSWKSPARELGPLFHTVHNRGFRRAILNTVISGISAPLLRDMGWHAVGLVHEMPDLIAKEGLRPRLRAMHEHADVVVYPHEFVSRSIAAAFPDLGHVGTLRCFPQGLVRRNAWRARTEEAKSSVRASLGIPADTPMVLGVGTGDLRKGIDLFLAVARIVNEEHRLRCAFVWIGPLDSGLKPKLMESGRLSDPSPGYVHLLGFQEDTAPYHSAADVFALTSREDPFPNVVMESMDAGVPVVAFDHTGGGAHLAATVAGRAVRPFDVDEYAGAILDLIMDPVRRKRIGAECQSTIDSDYSFRRYTGRILQLLDEVDSSSRSDCARRAGEPEPRTIVPGGGPVA